jgi:hypothetical protein
MWKTYTVTFTCCIHTTPAIIVTDVLRGRIARERSIIFMGIRRKIPVPNKATHSNPIIISNPYNYQSFFLFSHINERHSQIGEDPISQGKKETG